MPEYRAYTIGLDGNFRDVVSLTCDDDETAKKEAERLVDKFDIALWQRDRKVSKFLCAKKTEDL